MPSYRQRGTVLTDHTFSVPLDHDRPGGERIEVFAREVVAADRAGSDLPWLLFLQGGPGFGGPRLSGRGSWLDRALDDFRVLLLDQRGTGRSTPATRHTLASFGSARDQAAYLSLFRADAIVRDAELIRRELTGGEPWSVLGQSFGGFCTVTYLSCAPEGIREAFITGGLPGLTATADDVYRVTYPRVRCRTARGLPSRRSSPSATCSARVPAATICTTCWRAPFRAVCSPTRSCTPCTAISASPRDLCTRCCTKPATPSAPPPGGRHNGSGTSSRSSTHGLPSTAASRCCSPAR